ncbi:MAG TPA: aminotransferase class III-fold pyridoxal phosphate-dependent enzyme, partial [Jatrophihabitans sp.]
REFWSDSTLEKQTEVRALRFEQELGELAKRHAAHMTAPRGRGLVWGLPFREPRMARQVADAAFARGLLMETSGSYDQVVKLMPPLTSTDDELAEGLGILRDSVASAVVS